MLCWIFHCLVNKNMVIGMNIQKSKPFRNDRLDVAPLAWLSLIQRGLCSTNVQIPLFITVMTSVSLTENVHDRSGRECC